MGKCGFVCFGFRSAGLTITEVPPMASLSDLSCSSTMKLSRGFCATVPIFNSPELVDIIFGHAQISDCARLASTSRLVFNAAAPVIWRSLDSIIPLLELLQAEITELIGHDGPTTIVTLPSSSEADFTRFDVYAPFVKTLKIDCQIGDDMWDTFGGSISPWLTLHSRRQHKPILPNLSSLQLILATRKALIQAMWIIALASPSLRSIEALCSADNPEAVQVSAMASCMILETVTSQCPSLQRLSLFPDVVTVVDLPTAAEPGRTRSFPSLMPLNTYLPIMQKIRD